jgi:SAM-dependent methyltransferase
MSRNYTYPGEELEIFETAVNWKRYFSKFISPLLKGNILEPGAGIGGTTALLNKGQSTSWLLLEPDESQFLILQRKLKEGSLPDNCKVINGNIDQLQPTDQFDCILYIDVVEHIPNDKQEIRYATDHLRTGGHLVVLSPAFQFLYSPFDKAVGHYRRYSKKTIRNLTQPSLVLQRCIYLDSAGFFASLSNKLFLKQSYPSLSQVKAWDRGMIPISRVLDPLFFYSFGKSILATWKKQ